MLTVEKFKMWHDLRGNVLECQYLVILFFKVKIVLCKIYVIQKKCLAPVGWVDWEIIVDSSEDFSYEKKNDLFQMKMPMSFNDVATVVSKLNRQQTW